MKTAEELELAALDELEAGDLQRAQQGGAAAPVADPHYMDPELLAALPLVPMATSPLDDETEF